MELKLLSAEHCRKPGTFHAETVRVTAPTLTLDKEEKSVISPITLNFAVRWGKLGILTHPNFPEVF